MKNKKKQKKNVRHWVFLFALVVFFVDIFFQWQTRLLGFGVENTGISFGLGKSFSVFFRFFLPFILFLYTLWLTKIEKNPSVFLYLVLIGGLGNLISRILWGQVWDYISLPFTDLWINLSDVLISFGVISYILVDNGN